jgi:hypothetical protein
VQCWRYWRAKDKEIIMVERFNICRESISETFASELPKHLTAEQGALNKRNTGVLRIRK